MSIGPEWDIPGCEMLMLMEANGNDGSGNARNFTANGTISYAIGKFGNGAQFGATGDNFFSQAYAPNPESGTWTISFWAKFDNFTVSPYFFELYYGAGSPRKRLLVFGSTGGGITFFWGGNTATGPTLSTGKFYKFDIAIASGTAYFFVNGAPYGSVTPGATADAKNAGIYLGSTQVTSTNSMRGMVDNFVLLSIRRSAADIRRRYAFEKGMLV